MFTTALAKFFVWVVERRSCTNYKEERGGVTAFHLFLCRLYSLIYTAPTDFNESHTDFLLLSSRCNYRDKVKKRTLELRASHLPAHGRWQPSARCTWSQSGLCAGLSAPGVGKRSSYSQSFESTVKITFRQDKHTHTKHNTHTQTQQVEPLLRLSTHTHACWCWWNSSPSDGNNLFIKPSDCAVI